jgi:hypothetical protein
VWSDNIAFILCLFLKRLRSIPQPENDGNRDEKK